MLTFLESSLSLEEEEEEEDEEEPEQVSYIVDVILEVCPFMMSTSVAVVVFITSNSVVFIKL